MSDLSRPMYGHEADIDAQTDAAELGDSHLPSLRSGARRFESFGRAGRCKEWSSEELRQLRELAEAGTSLDAISVTLRRTASAIRNKAGMHGISLRGRR